MRKVLFQPSGQTATRLKVFHAVDRPIDTLTTTALCEKAGISRQLFYRYFESKYEIAFWYALECDAVSISQIGRTLTWMEGLEDFFFLMNEERDTLLHFAKSKESQAFRHRADERRIAVFQETIVQHHALTIDEELDFYIMSFANTFNKAYAWWLRRGMAFDPRKMARLTYELVPAALKNAMELEK